MDHINRARITYTLRRIRATSTPWHNASELGRYITYSFILWFSFAQISPGTVLLLHELTVGFDWVERPMHIHCQRVKT